MVGANVPGEKRRRRGLTLLALVLLGSGPLSGCLNDAIPLPGSLKPFQEDLQPAVPWLALALAEDGPAITLPRDVSEALAIAIRAPAETALALPGSTSLPAALAAYSATRARPLPATAVADLTDQVQALGLSADEEKALAALILAVVAADAAQQSALASLGEDERRLLGLDAAAVRAWFDEGNGTIADLDLELERLTTKVDAGKTHAAAQLLAQAVAEARVVLADRDQVTPLATADGWSAARELASGLGPAPPRAVDPNLGLATAIERLSLVLGVPAPPVPTLPADVDRALAQVVAAHTAGAGLEPAWQAQWVLDAVYDAIPILKSEGFGSSTAAAAPAPSPGRDCLEPEAPEAPEPTAGIPTPAPPVPEAPVAFDPTRPAIVVAIPTLGPACKTNPFLLVVTGEGSDLHSEPALLRIDLGGNDQYTGEVAGKAAVEDGRSETPVVSLGSINIDLGGNDLYVTPSVGETQGFAATGFSLLLDLEGNDKYEAGERSQGVACCASASVGGVGGPGGIGMLLDLAGNDTYAASLQSQGYASAGLVSFPSAAPTKRGVGGFLLDLAGNDEYRFATQGIAETCIPQESLQDSASDRVLAVLWDVEGNDTYRSRQRAVNTATLDVFSNQGLATCSSKDPTPLHLAAGVFLDSGGNDTYVALALPSRKPKDVSPAMDNKERVATETPSGQVPKAVSIFRDVNDLAGASPGPDADGDGFGDAAEMVAGTDPLDATDRPSDLQESAPDQAERWVFMPRPLSVTKDQNVLLPGLAILGPGDTALTESVDVVIDLGGDDLYAAPRLGGVLPYAQRPLAGTTGDQRQPWVVSLVVDFGDGNDTYRPPAVAQTHSCMASEEDSFCRSDSAEPDSFQNNPLLAVGASLGGAVSGVAFVADHGGRNEFTSTVLSDIESQEDTQTSGRQAAARSMGVVQGAGANGGLGILATWDAENDFTARVVATAREKGGLQSRPWSSALGVAQGSGWNGIGMLLTFGQGADNASVAVAAQTDPPSATRIQQLAIAQGAARGGLGLLVDGGGPATFFVDQPLAQGAGWTLDQRMDKPSPQGNVPLLVGGSTAASSAGILLAGPGTHRFEAPGSAQGAALGLASVPDGDEGDAYLSQVHDRTRSIGLNSPGAERLSTTNIRGLPAVGVLASLGGSDVYLLGPGGFGGQGRGLAGGVGILVDLAGDDLYDARGALGAQGSGHLGQGILVDVAGHDRYRTLGEGQGFAMDDPAVLAYVLACAGNPGQAGTRGTSDFLCTKERAIGILPPTHPDENIAYGTSQARLRLLGQFPTLGLLADRQGSDSYDALSQAQGAANATLQYAVEAGACKSKKIQVLSNSDSQTAFLIPCETPYYPGTDPDSPGYPEESPRPVPPTELDTAPPPSNGFVLGLFLDGSLEDRYVNRIPGQSDAQGGEPSADGNDWTWRNVVTPSSNLNQTRLPPDVGGVSLPGTSLPGQAGVLGLGVDNATLDAAVKTLLGEVGAAVGEVEVELKLARDAAGTPLEGPVAKGTVYLLATVRLADTSGFRGRLALLQDNEFLAQAEEVARSAGQVDFAYAWDTAAQPDGMPATPDGVHRMAASFFLSEGTSIESEPVEVLVDNPPVLGVSWVSYSKGVLDETDRLLLSPRQGHRANVDILVSPDIDPDGSVGGIRAGMLEVVLEGPDTKTLFDGPIEAGVHSFVLDGTCGPRACKDGTYQFRVLAKDAAGGVATFARAVTLDGTAPASTVDMPEYAGVAFRSGGQGLQVKYSATDANGTLAGSGLASIDLFRLHASGTLQRLGGGLAGQSVIREGVATNATLRLVTVARDRLGNTEGPCILAGGVVLADCAAAKVSAAAAGLIPVVQGPKNVTVDFSPPVIGAAESTHRFVAPGVTPVEFRASILEQGTGLAETVVRLDDGSRFPLVRREDGLYVFSNWNKTNAGRSALEEPFFYSFIASDLAGNAVTVDGDGILDALPPRMNLLSTQYRDGTDVERSAGRPGSQAFLTVEVVDAAVALVTANVSALEEGREDQECEAVAGPYVCPIFLPLGVADGTYEIPVTARDVAGNLNSTTTTLLVSNERLGIENLTITMGFDSATVRWTTPKPGTSQVFFGTTRTIDEGTKTLRKEAPLNASYTLEHEAVVAGLVPSTTYHFQAASQNEGGAQNVSGIITRRTQSALAVRFLGLDEDSVLSGNVTVLVGIRALGGTGNADELVVQANRRVGNTTIPQEVGRRTGVFGTVPVEVDTSLLADGPFNFTAEATRKGDYANATSSRVFVDNGAPLLTAVDPFPEGDIAAARPVLAVAVADGMGAAAVRPESVTVLIDGNASAVKVASWNGVGVQGILRLSLPPLRLGPHNITVTVRDWANNAGEITFPVNATGDANAISLRTIYRPGPMAARPNSTVQVEVTGAEGLALKSLRIGLGGTPIAMVKRPDGAWNGTLPIPAGTPNGEHAVMFYGVDGWEADVVKRIGSIFVDGDDPGASLESMPANPAFVRLGVTADEPVTLKVMSAGRTLFDSREMSPKWNPTLGPLTPGATHAFTARITDRAGNAVDLTTAVTLPADQAAPGLVGRLEVSAGPFGAPRITWEAAGDDGAVASYDVARSTWDSRATWFRNVTSPFIDRDAPVGQPSYYGVTAVDSAGNRGDAPTVFFERKAGPARLAASITPDRGTTATNFEIEVLYTHESGEAPDRIVALVSGEEVDLLPLDDVPECVVGCRYGATMRLPATTQFEREPLVVQAEWRGDEASLDVRQPPVVAVDKFGQGGKDAPQGLAGLAAVALALLLARRGRR